MTLALVNPLLFIRKRIPSTFKDSAKNVFGLKKNNTKLWINAEKTKRSDKN